MRKIARLLLAIIALAIVTILLGIVPFNAWFIRGPIETAVYDATGLPLSIRDRIVLRLGPRPSVTGGGIVFGNPADSPLLAVDSLHVKVGLFALLRGDIHVLDLGVNGIVVDYCSRLPVIGGNSIDGDSNEEAASLSIAVDTIELERVSIACGPPTLPDPLRIDIVQATGSAQTDAPIQINITGRVPTIDFVLTATGGELKQLLAKTDQFPLHVSLESASATAELSGHFRSLLDKPAVDAQLKVNVPDVNSISAALGLSLPALGALQIEGQVRGDVEAVELVGFIGELGESRFEFDTSLVMSDERTYVDLAVALQPLDLTPFIDGATVTNQPDQFSDDGDVDLGTAIDMLGKIDADLLVTASRILGATLELDAVEINAAVTNGKAELHSLTANVLGGNVSVSGRFDSQAECPELELLARGREFDLAMLNTVVTLNEQLGGHVDSVNLDTSSCGHTLPAHRDSLHAEAELLRGRMSLDGDPFPFEARRLNLGVEPGRHSRARLLGKLADEEVEATLTAGSLQALLSPGTWPLELRVRGPGSQFELRGQAGLVSGQPVLDAVVELDVPRVGALHSFTAGSPDTTLPLRTTLRLGLDESTLVADDIEFSLGRSDLSGDLVWSYAAHPDTLALTLHSGYLDLDGINTVFPVADEQSEQATTGTGDNERRLIPATFTLPPVDLDLTIDAVRGNQLDLQEFKISGRLREGLIDDARVSVRVEDEVLLRGTLDLDLRHSPARASLNVAAENADIGLVMARLEVADDLQLRADGIELLVTTEGETLSQILANTLLEARIQGFNWRIPDDNQMPGEETDRAFDLGLTQLRVTAAPDQPSTWTASGKVGDMPVEMWMEIPSLSDVLGETAELPLALVAAADTDVVMLEARVDRSAKERLAAHILLSGEVLESENRSLSQLVSPLAGYEIRSDLVLTENRLELPDLQMKLGSSSANGRFTVTDGGARRRFDIALHAPYLQTDDLLYWSRDVSEKSIDVNEAPSDDDETARDKARENRGVLFIARDFIARLRENNDFDISITVDELRAGPDLLGSGEIRLYVDEDDFNLKPLTLSLPGGGVNAEYTASIRDGRLDAGLRIHADALTYGGLLRLADHESEARGILYLDTDISANTEWSPDAVALGLLLKNAGGTVSFAAWPEDIEARVLDFWSANLVLALLPRPKDGKASRLNCIATRFDFDNGVMKSRAPLLDSTDTIIRGRGTIDFATEGLDLLVWPQAKREKFLSASTPVKVTGTFSDFQIGVEPAGFIGTMIKWYTSLIYVPYKWLTGKRFPPDGTATCFDAMDWELTPELHDYFLQRDFSAAPPLP